MKRLFMVSVLLLLILAVTGTMFAQVTGRIVVVGIPDRFKSTNGNESTYGLKAVGVGARVVLDGFSLTGTANAVKKDSLISVAWTVTSPKVGSTITMNNVTTNGSRAYFVPDTAGAFTVGMIATSKSGTTAQVTMKIIAAKYVGEGISESNAGPPSSCGCHNIDPTVFNEWQKTNHATVMPRRLDEVGGHFGNNCLPCHTVGYNKSTTAVNNGFDDVATSIGFNVPPNHPGLYDSVLAAQPGLMKLAGIQCENCHGPAGQHGKGSYPTAGNTNMDHTWSSDVCAPCHFSSDRHPKGYSWDASAHAVSMAEGEQFEYLNRSGCSQCHTAQGYVDQTIKGGTAVTYTNVMPITCQACHDPHSDKYPMQLRRATVADACTGCHTTRISSRGFHHSHQGPVLMGEGGFEFAGYAYPNSSHTDIADRCVDCHMAQTPTYDPTYAKADTLLNKIGGHTFKVVANLGTDAAPNMIVNDIGCRGCHPASMEFIELSQAKVQKLLDSVATFLPKNKTTGLPLTHADTTYSTGMYKNDKIRYGAAWNYYYISYDGSVGVHNHDYAMALLNATIDQLRLGAAAAKIVSVADVPGDNGKRVQVVWNQFPSEKYSINGIDYYNIWRQDPILPKGAAATKVGTLSEGFASVKTVGAKFTVAGNVWTFVGSVPKANMSMYSFIAPTIGDSTKTGGMKYTFFYVSGHSYANSSIIYASPVDSGYSLNNLIPSAPAGLVAANSTKGVVLTWSTAPELDSDIKAYNVYRGTSAGFTPTTPIGTVSDAGTFTYTDATVQTGVKYYYKVIAVDDGGNVSPASTEVEVTASLSVEMADNAVPKEFGLSANYPNPFNPETTFKVAVPKESHVTVTVYSISGQIVATLVNRTMSAGTWNVRWNGLNESGVSVSSGIYLYRMQAGSFVQTRKMMYIK